MASKSLKTKGSPSAATLPIVTDPVMAERFERELAWCMGQLECILQASSSKEKDPSQSALQILGNPKTSLVRKRQMMQQLFGDYRQKMQEEEATAARTCQKEIQVNPNSEIPLASRFVRRVHADADATPKETPFSFNFHIPPSDSGDQ